MEKIRTLGFYQPYGSLMLHGKVETRWVKTGKKPPFPLGKYLFYTTQKKATKEQLLEWSGNIITEKIKSTLQNEETVGYNQYAIGIGELFKVEPLTINDEGFVLLQKEKVELKDGLRIHKTQWALHFENVQRIDPFLWKYGKQGVGFVPETEIIKIKIIGNYILIKPNN